MRSTIPALLVLVVLVGGCSFNVNVNPYPVVSLEEKIPLDVGVLVSESAAVQHHSQSCLCMIGAAHTWIIHTGPAMALAAERTFQQVFNSVAMLKEASEFQSRPLTLLITPSVDQFNVSQSLAASMVMSCTLIDKEGTVLYESSIPVTASSHGGAACLLGVTAGQQALSDTSKEAFDRAFAILADDIVKKVDFSPYLA